MVDEAELKLMFLATAYRLGLLSKPEAWEAFLIMAKRDIDIDHSYNFAFQLMLEGAYENFRGAPVFTD